MSFVNLFKSLTLTSSRRRPTRRPSSARLSLEALEDRCMPSYSVIDLGTLGGTISHADDVNASGQVVGWSARSSGIEHAFLWQNGIMTDLGTLDGSYSTANGINDVGQIVGSAGTADGTAHPFLLTPEDTDGNGTPDLWFRDSNSDGKNDLMLDLGPDRDAFDVNNAGQVVGNLRPGGYDAHAFRWDNGVMTDLGTLGGPTSSATAINDAGQVTGTSDTAMGGLSAFLWQGGVMHDIGPFGPSDINQSGQVTGWANGYASLWTPTAPNGTEGSLTSLGALPRYPWGEYRVASDYSFGTGVNDSGSVVGISHAYYLDNYDTASFDTDRGFVWTDGVMENLGYDFGLQSATAINNAGQIVGNGPYDSTGNPTYPYRAFLLTPESATTPLVIIGDVSVTEGNSGTRAAIFTVSLSAASGETVTVAYATADGTATAGSDYQAKSSTLTFTPGETSKTITVLVNGDRLPEPNETFSVSLSNPTNATIADGLGIGTILDDEPRISISDVSKVEGKKNQTTRFTFTVTLSAAYDQAVTMSFRTVDGSATTSDGGYTAKTGTLTFAPGETTKTITIEVKGDSKREANETFYLDLFGSSSNALFTKNRGVGTILNDD
jgi:probable HAF family extracellular repeat protein